MSVVLHPHWRFILFCNLCCLSAFLKETNGHLPGMEGKPNGKMSFTKRYHQSLQNLKPFRWSSSQLVVSTAHYYTLFWLISADFWCFSCPDPILWTVRAFCPLQPLPGWHPWCGEYSGTRRRIQPHHCLIMMEQTAHLKGFFFFMAFLFMAFLFFFYMPLFLRPLLKPTVLQTS